MKKQLIKINKYVFRFEKAVIFFLTKLNANSFIVLYFTPKYVKRKSNLIFIEICGKKIVIN